MSQADFLETFSTIEQVTSRLASVGYVSTRPISTAVWLAQQLRKPVLVEGPAGVGKTDLAQSLAKAADIPLVRLQCYEGLDESRALYEWKYGKQILYTQILKDRISDVVKDAKTLDGSLSNLFAFDDLFFSREFLEPRPLLRAMEQDGGSVLLIDEIDKADDEFEAFLLEVLSDFQVTIPELGTIAARSPPVVVLTSNATRELSDALKRRCLHLYIGFPEAERERQIVESRVPGVSALLLRQLVAFIQLLRDENLRKSPSISETVDWARTLVLMHAKSLEPQLVRETLGVILKRQSDVDTIYGNVDALVSEARDGGGRRKR